MPVELREIARNQRLAIERYGEGRFTIAGQIYDGSVMVGSAGVISWPAADPLSLMPPMMAALLIQRPGVDIVLVGCGKRTQMLPRQVHDAFKAHGISIEAMDTGAAARTYNVLASEDRRVAAALIAVE